MSRVTCEGVLRHRNSFGLCALLAVLFTTGTRSTPTSDPVPPGPGGICWAIVCGRPAGLSGFTELPLAFEFNDGQSDARYQYLARGAGYSVYLADREAVLDFRDAAGSSIGVLRSVLQGASPAIVEPLDPLPGRVNYFRGADPARWITNIPTFRRVRHANVYPGVDVVYYGTGQQLEHDVIVRPGGDPASVRFRLEGADSITLEPAGGLRAAVGERFVTWSPPVIYQGEGLTRKSIAGGYRVMDDGSVGFTVAGYDRSRPLVIDPVVLYSTFLGRNGSDTASRGVVDSQGNLIFTGVTQDNTYPSTAGTPVSPATGADLGDVIVTKVNAEGTAMVFSTHLGGLKGEGGAGIALDPAGNIYIAGVNDSEDFPVTASAFQRLLSAARQISAPFATNH